MAEFQLLNNTQQRSQNQFELVGNLSRGANTARAALNVLKNNAGTRVINVGKEILNGEREVPRSPREIALLLSNTLFGSAGDPYQYVSQFDTPVRNYLLVTPGSYNVLNNEGLVEERAYPQVLIDSAIISVNKRKHIVKTHINSRSGSRKEYISDRDYQVTINGVLSTDRPTNYPTDDFTALKEVLDSNKPIEVVSPHLDRFGISQLVIESMSFPQEAGVYNAQKFTIKAISHDPEDVFININKKTTSQEESRANNVVEAAIEREQNLRNELSAALQEFFSDSDIGQGNPIINQ